MGEVVVLITTASDEEAQKIGRLLVEEGFVACANIIPAVRSIFRWEGQVTEEQETLLILKSVSEGFDSLAAKVKAHHSYDVPEIIALPIQTGSEPYMEWIREMSRPVKGPPK
jgi:periplasmic divalent cation tolerance protein